MIIPFEKMLKVLGNKIHKDFKDKLFRMTLTHSEIEPLMHIKNHSDS